MNAEPTVDAAAARRHIADLIDAGMSRANVALAAGVSWSTIHKILGSNRLVPVARIEATIETSILDVHPGGHIDQIAVANACAEHIDGITAAERHEAARRLRAQGCSYGEIARTLRMSGTSMRKAFKEASAT